MMNEGMLLGTVRCTGLSQNPVVSAAETQNMTSDYALVAQASGENK